MKHFSIGIGFDGIIIICGYYIFKSIKESQHTLHYLLRPLLTEGAGDAYLYERYTPVERRSLSLMASHHI